MKVWIQLDWNHAKLMLDVRERILRTLEVGYKPHGIEWGNFSVVCTTTWNPFDFISSQELKERPGDAIKYAITLIGDVACPQALTVEEYLAAMWPDTGAAVLDFLMRYVHSDWKRPSSKFWRLEMVFSIPERTYLPMSVSDPEGMAFAVTGLPKSIVEVCEILAWLGGALQTFPVQRRMVMCTPKVMELWINGDLHWHVAYEHSQDVVESSANGSLCWIAMFQSPVLVQGYPVARRQKSYHGLEVSLGAMAQMMRTGHLQMFDSRLYLKDFSAMLVAVASTPEAVMWHYLYTEHGTHVSYLATEGTSYDIDNEEASLLFTSRLHMRRHFIGWCSESAYLTGMVMDFVEQCSCSPSRRSKSASYAIEETGLPAPRAGAALEKLTVQGGKVITFGVQVALGQKDSPPHLPPDSYVSKLRWLEKRYVVLWDDAEKRGWLSNGISALLHLVRARLSSLRGGDFESHVMLREDELEDSDEKATNSAVKLLLHERNRCLEVFAGKNKSLVERATRATSDDLLLGETFTRTHRTQSFLFEDLVEEVFNYLEQLIEYQKKAAARQGIQIKTRLREQLEGWDFTDIAHGHDAHPRVTMLSAAGWGWVDFIRSINAVVLFGRGYGELLQARSTNELCPNWQSLPSGQSYLAANVSDLNNIMRLHGSRWTEPPQLAHGLIWHSPNALFDVCPCQKTTHLKTSKSKLQHASPVQILSPSGFKKAKSCVNPSTLLQGSAVIFGYNLSWKYSWRNNGADSVLDRNTTRDDTVAIAPSTSDVLSASTSTASQQTDQIASSGTIELSELSTPPSSLSAGSDSQAAIQSSSNQGPTTSQEAHSSSGATTARHREAGKKTKRKSIFMSLADRLRGRGA
jgi:hypothetical protein